MPETAVLPFQIDWDYESSSTVKAQLDHISLASKKSRRMLIKSLTKAQNKVDNSNLVQSQITLGWEVGPAVVLPLRVRRQPLLAPSTCDAVLDEECSLPSGTVLQVVVAGCDAEVTSYVDLEPDSDDDADLVRVPDGIADSSEAPQFWANVRRAVPPVYSTSAGSRDA
jgi:hypothetical protein